jgi:hypothetical protein
VTLADLPPELAGIPRPAAIAPPAPREQAAIEVVFDRMVKQRESFWSAVYPEFMARDLTRSDLRFIVKRGLQETAGSYKMLVELLNMKPTDYKRFLNFLRKHECHVPFERFRSIRGRQPSAREPDFPDVRVPVPDSPNHSIHESPIAVDDARR